ncbi:hypothetical protein HAX54_017941 [Datura stramonium]|uniref:Nodulin-like domain-containing protein n=1 Tax=Datura stramonium TaxID=4076 RepID=A0ABS8S1N3_DATST|nr:hypothetical protein [Datura stramonium]
MKWMILIATTWIQAFTGTNFDFSSYSSELKFVLGISQVQLNYLSMASDLGKAFGWCSGVSLVFPLWVVLLIAAFTGLVGYGLPMASGLPPRRRRFEASYCQPPSVLIQFILHLKASLQIFKELQDSSGSMNCFERFLFLSRINLAGISIVCWLAAVSAGLIQYASIVHQTFRQMAICTVPQHKFQWRKCSTPPSQTLRADSVLENISISACSLVLPLIAPGVICTEEWSQLFHHNSIFETELFHPGYISLKTMIPADDLGKLLEMVLEEASSINVWTENSHGFKRKESWTNSFLLRDHLLLLEEHSDVIRRLDFWLYYLAYFCGGHSHFRLQQQSRPNFRVTWI